MLAGAMVGDLTPPITLNNRNITWHQDMFSFSSLTLSKDVLMLNQPDFVWCGISAKLSKVMHGLGYGCIGL
ncbi:hypothetical [Yersinia pestis KIM10+]|uniref:Uncharacterized protein n=1 Tax=Yersinia pestis TaxID=632 RepID=Q8CLJ6_YERPE|nr:hypothetical [Yersinia pestis KIM10+]